MGLISSIGPMMCVGVHGDTNVYSSEISRNGPATTWLWPRSAADGPLSQPVPLEDTTLTVDICVNIYTNICVDPFVAPTP